MGEKLKRATQIMALLARHARPGLLAGPRDDLAVADTEEASGSGSGADRLASDLESMGPTFIKFGQLLSTRYDLLPPDYTDALARLQDSVDAVPAEQVRERIEAELGLRVRDLYTEFDDEPLGSASLGQVHRARTVTGHDVVVKVLRPDVREIVRADMQLLEQVASLVDARTEAGPRLGTADLLAQFRRSLADELDYRKELANLQRFRALAEGEDDLVIPEPFPRFSSAQVLTMEYLPGRKVTDVGPLGMLDVDGPALAEALFRFMLRTLLDEGLLHADPHPGNLLITPEGRLGIIDLGMVARVPRRVQSQLVKLLLAIGEGDGEQVATILASMGHPLPDHDPAAFRDEVSHLVSSTLTLGSELQAGAVLVELARLSGVHGLRPPAEMSLVGKSLLNLDQTVMHLDPTFSPGEAIKRNVLTLVGAGLSVSPGSAIAGALEAKEFAENLPRRANRVLDALADGELALRVDAFDEDRILAVAQRLANRVTMGIILAAITVAAALMTGIEGGPRLFGYPALAMVFFLIAALSGLGLVFGIWLTDRRTRKRAEAHERNRARGRSDLPG